MVKGRGKFWCVYLSFTPELTASEHLSGQGNAVFLMDGALGWCFSKLDLPQVPAEAGGTSFCISLTKATYPK